MSSRLAAFCSTALFSGLLAITTAGAAYATDAVHTLTGDGIIRAKSVYAIDETVARLKKDIEAKGIIFFMAVDQGKLAVEAGVNARPSTLLVFGNPPLGTQFITSNPNAGLDWPVRLLVTQDEKGDVWTSYTDFNWIARRHRISDRDQQFATANGVIASIVASVSQAAK